MAEVRNSHVFRMITLLTTSVAMFVLGACRQDDGADLGKLEEAGLVPPNSELIREAETDENILEEASFSRRYTVPLTPGPIVEFYDAELEARGWTFRGQVAMRSPITKRWTKGDKIFTIVVDNDAPGFTPTTTEISIRNSK